VIVATKKLKPLPKMPITLTRSVNAHISYGGTDYKLIPGDQCIVTMSRTARFGGVKERTHVLFISFVEHIPGATTEFSYKKRKSVRKTKRGR
jgi:hypothetical protein